MSFSFSIVAASPALASVAISSELDKVVGQQPIHSADRATIEQAADGVLALLNTPADGEEIAGSISGSVCRYTADAEGFDSVSMNFSFGVRRKN